MLNTNDYRIAPGGDGPQAFDWKDKPHRLVYDLCEEVERLRVKMQAAKVQLESIDAGDAMDRGGQYFNDPIRSAIMSLS